MYVWSGYEWLIASTAVTSTFVEYDFTATNGQTLFNTPERINPEFTQVFLNGIFLPQTDFTAEANSITLDEGANAGDSVVVVSYQEAAYAPVAVVRLARRVRAPMRSGWTRATAAASRTSWTAWSGLGRMG